MLTILCVRDQIDREKKQLINVLNGAFFLVINGRDNKKSQATRVIIILFWIVHGCKTGLTSGTKKSYFYGHGIFFELGFKSLFSGAMTQISQNAQTFVHVFFLFFFIISSNNVQKKQFLPAKWGTKTTKKNSRTPKTKILFEFFGDFEINMNPNKFPIVFYFYAIAH